MVIFLKKSF